MTRKQWKSKIIKQMKAAGTYKDIFASPIEALSEILEQRDKAFSEFLESGGETVTEFVSDRGAVNLKKNPRLQAWSDLNKDALAYWRDLGLTPAGLKRLNELALKENQKQESALEEALKKLSG